VLIVEGKYTSISPSLITKDIIGELVPYDNTNPVNLRL
jgi:hypothetical protein